jgi:hypothetical protein
MKFKKLLAVLISVMLILGLAACGEDNNDDTPAPDANGNNANGDNNADGDNPAGDNETQDAEFSVEGRFDLGIPPDSMGGGGTRDIFTFWVWVAHGTDQIYNDIDPSVFQNARYLVIEFAGEIDLDAKAGLAWQSSFRGDRGAWYEDQNGIDLEYYVVGGDKLVLPLYDLLEDYTNYRHGELEPDSNGDLMKKIIFRYGDERDRNREDLFGPLNITAVYFATSVTGI